MRCFCMLLASSCGGVCTHIYMVRVGSCGKCELCHWEDVPGDNLWYDSPTGIQGSGESVTEGKIVRIAGCVNGLHPDGATLPSGRK